MQILIHQVRLNISNDIKFWYKMTISINCYYQTKICHPGQKLGEEQQVGVQGIGGHGQRVQPQGQRARQGGSGGQGGCHQGGEGQGGHQGGLGHQQGASQASRD